MVGIEIILSAVIVFVCMWKDCGDRESTQESDSH